MSETAKFIVQFLFSNGHVVDIALGVIALEFAYLLWRAPPATKSTTILTLALALGPGVCLMLALRCALVQVSFVWIAFWLAMSLPLHIADLSRRKL